MAARRSARRVSTVPPVILRLESACAALGTPAAAVRMVSAALPCLGHCWTKGLPSPALPAPLQHAQQAGLGLAARQGVPVPTRGIATRRLDTAAVPLGGPASAASEVVPKGARPGPGEGPGRSAQGDPGPLSACDSGHWGYGCSRPCNCSAGNGSCEATSGLCVCEAGYTGTWCEQRESTRRSPAVCELCAHPQAFMHMCVGALVLPSGPQTSRGLLT